VLVDVSGSMFFTPLLPDGKGGEPGMGQRSESTTLARGQTRDGPAVRRRSHTYRSFNHEVPPYQSGKGGFFELSFVSVDKRRAELADQGPTSGARVKNNA